MPAPKYIPHYTFADYQQWDGDWELWNGIAVAMTPSPFGRHQKVLARLSQRLLNAIDAVGCVDCEVAVELDWVIANDTVVRPDVSVVCHADLDRYIDRPPSLIIEVLSESTEAKDRTAKFELYERQKVRYYMLIDPDTSKPEGYELHSDGTYRPMTCWPQATLELHANCRLQLHFAPL